jgi:hypothetical protein
MQSANQPALVLNEPAFVSIVKVLSPTPAYLTKTNPENTTPNRHSHTKTSPSPPLTLFSARLYANFDRGRGYREITWRVREPDSTFVEKICGCPPGIRTPIERVRVASPTIERGGNRLKGAAGIACWLPFRVYEVKEIRSTPARVSQPCMLALECGHGSLREPDECGFREDFEPQT